VIAVWWRRLGSLGLLASGLVGCTTLARPPQSGIGPAAIAHAYQQGVRDAHAQLASETGSEPRGIWSAPLVQEVWIPAQVVHGVFIPGHREWVVVYPADWHRSSQTARDPGPVWTPPNDRAQP
jgi:hypothetical protein